MYVALVTYSKCIGCSGYLQQVYLLRMLGKPQGDGGNKDIQCLHILVSYYDSIIIINVIIIIVMLISPTAASISLISFKVVIVIILVENGFLYSIKKHLIFRAEFLHMLSTYFQSAQCAMRFLQFTCISYRFEFVLCDSGKSK